MRNKIVFLFLFFLISSFLFSQTLKICMYKAYYTLDPALAWDSTSPIFNKNIYDKLVEINWRTFKPVPSLAESWYSKDDGKKWIFNLRKGIKFNNGEEFTADAVVFTFNRLLNPKSKYWVNSPIFNEFFNFIKSVKKISKYQVEIDLKYKFAPFLKTLSMDTVSILSPKAFKIDKKRFYLHGAGTGMFYIDDVKEDYVILRKNENYWRKAGNLKEIVVAFGTDVFEMIYDFEQKKCDMVFSYSLSKLKAFEKISWMKVLKKPILSFRFISFNPEHNRLLYNKDFRKALFHAWSPNVVSYVFQDTIKPFSTYFIKGMPGYIKEGLDFDFSLKKALLYFKKAKIKKKPEIMLPIEKGSDLFIDLVSIYKKMLKKIGVELKINLFSTKKIGNIYSKGNYDLAVNGWTFDYPDIDNLMVALFSKELKSEGFPNMASFTNNRIKKLIVEGRSTFDNKRRDRIYRELNRIIYNDVFSIPIGLNVFVLSYNRKLNNVEVYPDGTVEIKKIYIKN